MRLNQINTITFKRTFDIHTHKGHWWCMASEDTAGAIRSRDGSYKILKDLTSDIFEVANKEATSASNNVEKAIVSNLDCLVRSTPDGGVHVPFLKDEIEGNQELLLKSTNPNEFLYATGQVGSGNPQNLRQIIEQAPDKFVGIKLHPCALGIPADSELYEPYMELASEKKLPVLFHSQINAVWAPDKTGEFSPTLIKDVKNWNHSDPRKIYTLAKKFPDVPVILGHTGTGAGKEGHKKAIEVILESLKNKDAKLYCDISWMDFNKGLPVENPESIIQLIKDLKKQGALDRILFGSDIPVGIFGEYQASNISNLDPSSIYNEMQNKIKSAIKNDSELSKDADEIIDMIFYKNAQSLFFDKALSTAKKSNKKLGIICAAAALAFLGAGVFIASKIKNRQKTNS